MRPESAGRLERLLAALERELIEATDEEILDAAGDIGMNPLMKGSAAFFGITVARSALWPADPRESAAAPGARRRSKDDPPP